MAPSFATQGSLCAERAAIASALAADLTLARRDMVMIAVLGLPPLAGLKTLASPRDSTVFPRVAVFAPLGDD